MTMHIKGFDKVMKNLNREIHKIKGRSAAGLIEAAAMVRKDMDVTPPMIPIDVGNLRGSYFLESITMLGQPAVRMGFGASYAWWVHENVDAHFSRPGSGAKFFESALKRNSDEILEIIRKNAHV